MRLGELLIANGVVEPAQVDEALSRQILHGGRIGSNLLELEYISMEILAESLGLLHGHPPALEAYFTDLDRQLAARLTPEQAATWHAVPLGYTGGQPRQVAIATTDLLEPEILEELQAIFDAPIVQTISPELRLLYWLEQVYQIGRVNRHKRIHRLDSAPPTGASERRGYVQTLSADTKAPPTSHLARIAVKRISVQRMQTPTVDHNDIPESLRAIRGATGRNSMAETVCSVLEHGFGQVFSAGLLLSVREPLGVGWRGFVRGREHLDVDALAVSLTGDSMLAHPYAQCASVWGMPDPPSLLDKLFWQYLGGAPRELAILPVQVDSKVVCIVYVQSDNAIPQQYAAEFGELGPAISACLTRLIRSAGR